MASYYPFARRPFSSAYRALAGRILCAAIGALLLAIGIDTASAQDTARQPDTIAFVGGSVVSPDFARMIPDQTVIIRGDGIVQSGPSDDIAVPADAKIVDARGRFLIPGLWDAHIHSRYLGIDHLRLLIAHGITATRDMGGPWDHLARQRQWRSEIEQGTRVGPRIWTGGTVLDNPGAGWSHITIVNTPGEARAAVQKLKREGADFVKVYSFLTPENHAAIVDEADRQGLQFGGHVPFALTAQQAVAAGQHSIEHIDAITLAIAAKEPERFPNGAPNIASLQGALSAQKAQALAAQMNAADSFLVPTMALEGLRIRVWGPGGTDADNPALRYIPAVYRDQWSAQDPVDPARMQRWIDGLSVNRDTLRLMHDAGAKIVAGSDTVKPFFVPGDALHAELEALVAAGMAPGEAIRAATLAPAQMMGRADMGLITPGYRADIVMLDANPLTDIANSRRIGAVMAAGRLYDRPALDAMLDDIAAQASAYEGPASGR